jgi:hypothetical protein
VLLIVSYRPDFIAPWIGQAGVTVIALSRLPPRQAAKLASQVVVDRTLPVGMLDSIVAQSDGVPLFIEELTKAVLEGAGEPANSALPVPSTLQASLMARLDRMPAAKQVAQIGAVIGREFGSDLLGAVAGLPDRSLAQGLEELVAAGLVFRRDAPPEFVYTFKHALVQEAAYASLLRGTRQTLHARIAKALETKFPERVEAEPQTLAHHFTQARLSAEAVDYWLRAGERAAARSANVEAVAHLRRGLELVADLPAGTSERGDRELALWLAIGPPLIATQGFAASETTEAHARARELCERHGNSGQLLSALYGEWAGRYTRSEVPEMRALATRFSALVDGDPRPGVRLVATRMLAIDRLVSGDLPEARRLFEIILAGYDPAEKGLAQPFGLDARAACLTYQAWVLWALGYPEQGARAGEAAIAWAEELTHANSKGNPLCWGGAMVELLLRRPVLAETKAREAIRFCDEARLPFWGAYGRVFLGIAMVEQGGGEAGLSELRRGLDALAATGARGLEPLLLAWTAQAEAKAGFQEDGARTIERALASVSETDQAIWIAELHRIRASLRPVGDADVENDLWRAVAFARAQHSRSFELRAATDLARRWHDQARHREARELLAPIYACFEEGFTLPDLQDAKLLLDALA